MFYCFLWLYMTHPAFIVLHIINFLQLRVALTWPFVPIINLAVSARRLLFVNYVFDTCSSITSLFISVGYLPCSAFYLRWCFLCSMLSFKHGDLQFWQAKLNAVQPLSAWNILEWYIEVTLFFENNFLRPFFFFQESIVQMNNILPSHITRQVEPLVNDVGIAYVLIVFTLCFADQCIHRSAFNLPISFFLVWLLKV